MLGLSGTAFCGESPHQSVAICPALSREVRGDTTFFLPPGPYRESRRGPVENWVRSGWNSQRTNESRK